MPDITIERVAKPDIAFDGELIGQSSGSSPALRIYRTKAGKFVAALRKDAQRADAGYFDKPADLIKWVTAQLNNTLTLEAQTAIEKAREADKDFKAFWTERVD